MGIMFPTFSLPSWSFLPLVFRLVAGLVRESNPKRAQRTFPVPCKSGWESASAAAALGGQLRIQLGNTDNQSLTAVLHFLLPLRPNICHTHRLRSRAHFPIHCEPSHLNHPSFSLLTKYGASIRAAHSRRKWQRPKTAKVNKGLHKGGWYLHAETSRALSGWHYRIQCSRCVGPDPRIFPPRAFRPWTLLILSPLLRSVNRNRAHVGRASWNSQQPTSWKAILLKQPNYKTAW